MSIRNAVPGELIRVWCEGCKCHVDAVVERAPSGKPWVACPNFAPEPASKERIRSGKPPYRARSSHLYESTDTIADAPDDFLLEGRTQEGLFEEA